MDNTVAARRGPLHILRLPAAILRIQLSVLFATTGMGMVYSVLALDAKSLGATAFMRR